MWAKQEFKYEQWVNLLPSMQPPPPVPSSQRATQRCCYNFHSVVLLITKGRGMSLSGSKGNSIKPGRFAYYSSLSLMEMNLSVTKVRTPVGRHFQLIELLQKEKPYKHKVKECIKYDASHLLIFNLFLMHLMSKVLDLLCILWSYFYTEKRTVQHPCTGTPKKDGQASINSILSHYIYIQKHIHYNDQSPHSKVVIFEIINWGKSGGHTKTFNEWPL